MHAAGHGRSVLAAACLALSATLKHDEVCHVGEILKVMDDK